ncbi:MAG: hypothetical protein ACEQSR_01995 [Candidatus Methylacidiphilales bacterium]
MTINNQTPVVVLFGGNPNRRNEVLSLLNALGNISVYGTLSEEEGILQLKAPPKVDLVLIGGRYTDAQRERIKAFIAANLPHAKITEPGGHYPYQNEAIKADIKLKLGL